MFRSALLLFLCAGTADAQAFPSHEVRSLAFCQQARADVTVPPAALIQCSRAEYTEEARIAHLSGFVTLSLTVDDEGMPNEIHVVKSLGLGLDENAASCMRQSRYSPAQKDGKPVPLKVRVSLPFDEHWNSDWHLAAAAFRTPRGISRPVIVKARYPGATGDRRMLAVCLHLVVGKDGIPRAIEVPSPRDARLDKEAIAIVSGWRFRPGAQNRVAVDVPAVLTLEHGAGSPVMASTRHVK